MLQGKLVIQIVTNQEVGFFFLTQKLWENLNMKLITTKFSLNHSLSDSPVS